VRLSLQPTLDPSDYRYTHVVRTRFAETDAMGIIHHGSFPAYLEEARAAMLRDAGFPYGEVRSGPDGIDFAVLELYVRHRRPLRFEDEVSIHGRRPHPHHLPGRLPPRGVR
jgi:acyl-CoA thioester hydrolase